MSDEQMKITIPPGSVGTGTDPGFHRGCEGNIFQHGGKHPNMITLTAPCFDCRYQAIFIIYLMLLSGYDNIDLSTFETVPCAIPRAWAMAYCLEPIRHMAKLVDKFLH